MFVAINPNPEHQHIGFRLTDIKTTEQFDKLWEAQDMSMLDEFGGDMPLLCDEFFEPIEDPSVSELRAEGITQVLDITFDQWIAKVKEVI